FLVEQVKGTIDVAWTILNPRSRPEPGIIEIPFEVEKPWQKLMVANMITYTPGSVSTMLSPDRSRVYVHVLDLNPRGHMVASARLFERMVRGVGDGAASWMWLGSFAASRGRWASPGLCWAPPP